MYTTFFLIFSLIGIFFSKHLYKSFFAPLGFYSMLWGGTLLLFKLGIMPYPKLSVKTHIILLLSFISFIGACITIGYGDKLFYKRILDQNSKRYLPFKGDLKFLIIAGSILSLIGGAMALKITFDYFGAAVFTLDARNFIATHSQELGKTWLSHIFLLGINFTVASIAGVYIGLYSGRYLPAYLPLISIMLFSFAELSRSYVYEIVIIYVISIIFARNFSNRKAKNQRKLFLITGILLIGLTFVIIMGELLSKHSEETEIANIPLPKVVAHFYYRLTQPLVVLDAKLQTHSDKYLGGYATFNVIMRTLYALDIIEKYNRVTYYDRNPITGWTGFTVPSYLMYLFDDFGYYGIILIPYMLGLWASIAYLRMNRQPSISKLCVITLIYSAMFATTRTWHFWNFFFTIAIIFSYSLNFIINLKKSRKRHLE